MAKVTKYSMSCGCVGVCTCGAQGIIINPGQGGARGAQGRTGAQGATGAGTQGVQGSDGPMGPGGGAQGTTGSQGASGTGVQGTTGSQGTAGTGIQGTTGSQGAIGAQGTTGSGTQGTSGSQGIQGVQGGGVSLQDVEDLIANSTIGTTDELTEGSTNKYFTVGRVSYEHIQDEVSKDWVIVHNLGFRPNVTVVDSAGTIYEGEIAYTNTTTLTVSFSAAFSGKAFLS